ncbi:bifunctional 5,10-methylenetetrahydrofolate dehydrogenase/5,10-methenyltetrahydrofolate cyclohydrolase [Candidatus Woesearchaeota archaeon]|nr:bifunctional 5,10-methylenetetrahydrofolate dehydrogenase/5,10-methenyltetrahydrofolate cyclohydrolase [Candidatus Woesearchaeota archaeon]
MTCEIFDGKSFARKIIENTKKKISELKTKPVLAVILVGDNEPSHLYVELKEKACNEAGISLQKYFFKNSTTKELISLIRKLNESDDVDGILVQLPLPEGINKTAVLKEIAPKKDVDFLNPVTLGQIMYDNKAGPCTPRGIMRIIEENNIQVEGKNVCIINDSDLVGKPLALMLMRKGATVFVCNNKTKNIYLLTRDADIVISATGVPGLVKGEHVKEGVVAIDIGISKVNNKIFGDLDFKTVKQKASFITPVPGGVGPVTVAMLVENMYKVSI